jgi:hypothetical protein
MRQRVSHRESNREARALAERMIDKAAESDEDNSDVDLAAGDEDEYSEDGYDSDDPRSFGGQYYWDEPNHATSIAQKSKDLFRLLAFHIYRFLEFVLLVLSHFFGFNQSRYQWAVTLVEKEKDRRENAALERLMVRQKLQSKQ